MKVRRLNIVEKERWKRYRKQGSSEYARCKINVFVPSVIKKDCESLDELDKHYRHEEMKFRYWYNLVKQGHLVICEAHDKALNKRRDLVDLTTGEIYEFETDMTRAERHEKGVTVVIVDAI